MNEIEKWMSESTFDTEIRQQIGIFCTGYKTFTQIAKAYPKGSGEFLQELKDKQNDKLIGNQRVAVGILFEKIEQSEQSGVYDCKINFAVLRFSLYFLFSQLLLFCLFLQLIWTILMDTFWNILQYFICDTMEMEMEMVVYVIYG